MKSLTVFFKGYYKESILGPLFKLFEALLELMIPMIVARVIDTALVSQNTSLIIRYIILMLVIGLVGFSFSITAQYFSAKAAVGYTRQLNERLFEKILALPQSAIDTTSPASLVNRLTNDTLQIQSGLNIFFRLFLRSPFIVLGSLVMAVRLEPRVTAVFSGMIILLFIIVGGILYGTAPLFVKVRQTLDRLVQQTRQQMKGIRVIRAFRQEQREIDEFQETNNRLYRQTLFVTNINLLTNPLTYVVVNGALILVLWQGGHWIHEGAIQQGSIVALVNYLLQILVELVKLTMVVTMLNKSYASAKRVVDVLDKADEMEQFDNGTMSDPVALYQFNHVQFTYPNGQSPALHQLDFSIRVGEFFGIIGSTGAGKSAVLELITKTYDATKGSIAINPQLVDVASRKRVRQSISLVPQSATLFQGTVRSNLQMAYPDASEAMMWQALEVAQAADFIRKKRGLDTPVTAFGRNFSGGQRQRLTIARALVKPAQVYVFDDSTSALDYLTEAKFQQALKQYYGAKTIIMISQRTHSVESADQILVLDEGKQVGLGTHQSLLKDCSVYQEIHQSQQVKEVNEHA
ncbi:ABC transporter ATP-binding protein [Tuanshanicoccus lijuaniae]|uniref:ABC transporter ATP-binding protein n=1 Tax=Aerococcaceae bacterium zg-1292 TaxID=2774330 RepID=UPI001BD809AE|nr:ABC transporter ATP-binding protein [Aerococcaceae bacterium zg-A91]MBS4457938.1 ABC transporter ATP-binding protein [Aerococcaceae bacterium zg-BR33]